MGLITKTVDYLLAKWSELMEKPIILFSIWSVQTEHFRPPTVWKHDLIASFQLHLAVGGIHQAAGELSVPEVDVLEADNADKWKDLRNSTATSGS